MMDREDLDVTDRDAVLRATEGVRVIAHLAALTKVDKCEAEPELAQRVNHLGTKHIADAAIEHGARLVYLSTDYVFDGTKHSDYDETDVANPVNIYGRTKLAGESEAARVPDHWILRSSWIFGDGANFIRAVIARARSGSKPRVVDDQIGRPTAAHAVAAGIRAMIEREGDGIVHVAGDGEPCSWADLAEFALGCAGLDPRVERISTETYRAEADGVIAPRPSRSVLALDKARALAIPLLDWRDSVRQEIGR